jgi:hypothetical protein
VRFVPGLATLSLKFNIDISWATGVNSTTFQTQLASDVSKACKISASRVVVASVISGSAIVGLVINPQSGEVDSATAVKELYAQSRSPTSLFRTQTTYGGAVDPTFESKFGYACAGVEETMVADITYCPSTALSSTGPLMLPPLKSSGGSSWQSTGLDDTSLIIIIVCVGGGGMILICGLGVWCCRRQKHKEHTRMGGRFSYGGDGYGQPDMELVDEEGNLTTG